MKKLAIFDYDGTLLDSYDDACQCIENCLDELNYPKKNIRATNFKETINNIFEEYNLTTEEFVEFISLFKKRFSEDPKVNTRPFEGINEMLHTLEDNDILLAINSKKMESEILFYNEKYFNDITFVDIAGYNGIDVNKPDPTRIFKLLDK